MKTLDLYTATGDIEVEVGDTVEEDGGKIVEVLTIHRVTPTVSGAIVYFSGVLKSEANAEKLNTIYHLAVTTESPLTEPEKELVSANIWALLNEVRPDLVQEDIDTVITTVSISD